MSAGAMIVCHEYIPGNPIVPGSGLRECSECGVRCILAPTGLEIIRKHNARVLCTECLACLPADDLPSTGKVSRAAVAELAHLWGVSPEIVRERCAELSAGRGMRVEFVDEA